jgi:hypothetical protein
VRDHHDAVDVEQVDAGDAAGQRGRRHPTARGSDDLGIAEGQSDHFERRNPGVHAGDHQHARMGYPVEAVLIKVRGESLVVGQ